MRLPVNHLPALAAVFFLSGCVSGVGGQGDALSAVPGVGPAADYPVVTGEPFTIGATTYTPVDTLNYDAVGLATVSGLAGARVAGAHKTLPLPSYVEVTDLESGRTILVRLETRGPLVNDVLIELTPGAAAQLGLVPGASAAVRVRRVNPPEAERALLRLGQQAPQRMDTPKPLLQVLKRKLAVHEPVAPSSPAMTPVDPDPYPDQLQPAAPPAEVADAPAPALPEPEPEHAVRNPGDLVVQVAAFSSRERALRAARPLGGNITKPGEYWRLQLGPFETVAQAGQALETARAAGYSDARIERVN